MLLLHLVKMLSGQIKRKTSASDKLVLRFESFFCSLTFTRIYNFSECCRFSRLKNERGLVANVAKFTGKL